MSFPVRQIATLMATTWLFAISSGCQGILSKDRWCDPLPLKPCSTIEPLYDCSDGAACPAFTEPASLAELRNRLALEHDCRAALELAEATYSMAISLNDRGNESCVDYYYQTVACAWFCLSGKSGECQVDSARVHHLYHSALTQLLQTAQEFCRLDATSRLEIRTPIGIRSIPVQHHGFPWADSDFDRVVVVGDNASDMISRRYQRCGFGVRVVVIRQSTDQDRSMFQENHPFSATVVLRPDITDVVPIMNIEHAPIDGACHGENLASLSFFNPLTVFRATIDGRQYELTGDITSALVYAALNSNWNPYLSFFEGDAATPGRLYMMEPYDKKRIPIIFVHGLISDPKTYYEVVNELRALPYFRTRYQVWGFEYPTGGGFLQSSAQLHAQLQSTFRQIGGTNASLAARNAVIIGHSMGGLIAKLQVVSSGDTLWNHVSNRPLDQINASQDNRQRLRRLLFFEPIPNITRTIMIATPHDGSPWADRCFAKIAADSVHFSREDRRKFQQLIDQNPGVFHPFVTRRLPTSIDMLTEGNPILNAIKKLCFLPGEKLHSIIGTGQPLPHDGPADGVVPVFSAQHPGVESEFYVHAKHMGIQRDERSIREMERILYEHYETVFRRGNPPDALHAPHVIEEVETPVTPEVVEEGIEEESVVEEAVEKVMEEVISTPAT